jgi:hypothetical protein
MYNQMLWKNIRLIYIRLCSWSPQNMVLWRRVDLFCREGRQWNFTDSVEILNGKSVSDSIHIKFLLKCTSHFPFLSCFVQSNRIRCFFFKIFHKNKIIVQLMGGYIKLCSWSNIWKRYKISLQVLFGSTSTYAGIFLRRQIFAIRLKQAFT